ncbi:ATP-binding cassette domain-containing protein [Exiguobacterium sp. 17-1]|uniref:methionine ABC transporter ATP-binding protein n=1 Tax=Exiguobacterium sp. 17-1 TaxID=2931981 RepID=UPI001FFE3E8A|nr:ATP-binding cassette domain-containing protein [Exiguobacterium sp. 17-1]MCK2157666.1 ATP-binding cassette domain-containing protein [Exiguobacterium sp. 17-1]
MISLQNVSKAFSGQPVIQSVALSIEQGEIHGIIGASGAGKSTLLRLMNLLERPDTGQVEFDGMDLTNLSNRQLRQTRQNIGMIFQDFNLVGNKTVEQNIGVSLELARVKKRERADRIQECLRFVGLESFARKYPSELSGGQKQRVAIARALANRPRVLLCDEPTSSLDPSTTSEILRVLQDINQTLGVTIVLVSHEMQVIQSVCNRVTVMADGQIETTMTTEPAGITEITSDASWFLTQLTERRDSDA